MTFRWRAVAAATLLLVLSSCGKRIAHIERPNTVTVAIRPTESRFSEFAWAPVQPSGARVDSVSLARSLAKIEKDTPRSRGVAQAILGNFAQAADDLDSAAAAAPRDAAAHNDAAAAWLALAIATEKPSRLVDALRESDAALRLAPDYPAALFNRALVLDRLGLSKHASYAWRDYLKRETSSAWADEARLRLHRDIRASDTKQFAALRPALERAATVNDVIGVQRIVRRFPQQARTWGETEYLGRWGESLLHGRPDDAEHWLRIASAIGDALTTVNGEGCLHDAAQAIFTANDEERAHLATAHDTYRRARQLLSKLSFAAVEPHFRRVIRLFAHAKSPMMYVAKHYAATCAYEQGRRGEARAALRALLTHIEQSAPAYRALHAQAQQELALCEAAGGRWSASIAANKRAAETFATLGESGNEGFATDMLADAWDYLGQTDMAWRERIRALRLFDNSGTTDRVAHALGSAVDAELHRGNRWGALSLLALRVAGIGASDVPRRIDALLRRAHVETDVGDIAGAWRDVESVKSNLATINDPAVRQQLTAIASMTEARLARRSNPRRAIALVDQAMKNLRLLDRRIFFPTLLLERARANRDLGDRSAAEADYSAAIDLLDDQRSMVAEGQVREFVFDAAPPLFAEATDLAALRSATDALTLMERSRARGLLEALDIRKQSKSRLMPTGAIRATLPRDTAIVEYGFAVATIVAVVVTRNEIREASARINVKSAAHAAERLRRAIDANRRAEIDTQLANLYDELFLPIEIPPSIKRLIIVPDRFLQTIPFSALRNRNDGSYLVERYEITVAPSATFWTRSSQTQSDNDALLIVADPTPAPNVPRLRGARREAAAIARSYPRATRLEGSAATADRFMREASTFSIIHFAGHGSVGSSGVQPSLLFAEGEQLWAPDLARLDLRRTRIIVLAACDTFHGDTMPIEGMPSVVRAFLYAGVPTVVGTLWRIDDDDAAWLFANFYRELSAGHPAAAALRSAQRAAISRGRDVASWAGIELIGTREMAQ